jgi:hypothetical protein
MRNLLTIPAFLVLFSAGVFGQSEEPKPQEITQPPASASACPQIEVRSQGPRTIREGQPIAFTANIAGGDKNVTPSIVWNVSGGAIKDGQGTPRIDVDSNGAGTDRRIVADLWVGGYAPECTTQKTYTISVVPPARKADEFGELAAEQEKERIEAAAAAVAQNTDYLYVIAYAGRTSPRGYASAAVRRIKTQLSERGISAPRIFAFDGGFREEPAYEIWFVPEGAEPPRPTPTVDRREIVYPKTTPAKRTTPAKKT